MNCGHVCERACHPKIVKHTEYVCKKLCSKYSCQYGHKCKERCHFAIECGKCTTPVSKRITPCGHTWHGKCWEIRDQVKCLELVKKELTCGHYRDIPCYQDVTEAKCSIKCTYTLACGHERTRNCSNCNMGRLHIQCKLKCERILICCHVCEENCNEDCPPCKKKCEIIANTVFMERNAVFLVFSVWKTAFGDVNINFVKRGVMKSVTDLRVMSRVI